MWRSGRPSTHHERRAGVPEFFQRSENVVSASSAQSRDVLNEQPRGSEFSDDAPHLPPQAGSGCVDTAALARGGDILTGETACDEIHSGNIVSVEFSHVGEPGHVGPMTGKDGSAEGIDFALSDDAHSGSLEAEVNSADAGEEGEDIRHTICGTTSALAYSSIATASASLSFVVVKSNRLASAPMTSSFEALPLPVTHFFSVRLCTDVC